MEYSSLIHLIFSNNYLKNYLIIVIIKEMFGEIQLMQYVKPDWVLVQNKTVYDIIETIEEN